MKRWVKLALAMALFAPLAVANTVQWKLWIDCGTLAGDGHVYLIVGEVKRAIKFQCGREA